MFKKLMPLLMLAMLILSTPVLASDNIQFISGISSEKEIVVKSGDKLMLDKEWYTYSFEINPEKEFGPLKLQPVDPVGYKEALDQVNFPLEKLGTYKVYFLDYRLKNYASAMALSFMDDSVVVFGTFFAYTPEKLHQLAVHELGHQVDFSLMDSEKWNEYKRLRNITNSSVYHNTSDVHADRPQEIFAEDFRLLFGGETAKKIPHLNQKLPSPDTVRGLKEFMAKLAA